MRIAKQTWVEFIERLMVSETNMTNKHDKQTCVQLFFHRIIL